MMAKICPITNEKVLYLTCLECAEKICKEVNLKNVSALENKQHLSTKFDTFDITKRKMVNEVFCL